ncbi:MAG: ABC transporter ATP-binding protein [Kiritimatiellae bacterium]|nr:ABC transporter ATP-binding protein [Kiritimatiellia bacterium]
MKISLQNVSKQFGGVRAVDSVSFEAGAGECFFLLGPSGCGKTTVLRIIAGFCRPDSGLVCFNDKPVNHLAAHLRNVGLVFQNYALWPHLTVGENIAFGLTVPAHRLPEKERRERVRQMLDALHLRGMEKRLPGELSGGQQQRVALARALIIQPACLLLDEPLSNLDAKLRADMRLEIKHVLKKLGITAIYVTHDQTEALSMADRCAIMRLGRIEQIGAPRELYEHPASRFVADFLGCSNLFDARVVAQDADVLQLETVAGGWVSRGCRRQFKPGAAAAIAVRPEKVRIGAGLAAVGGENVFSGRLREMVYLGSVVEHHVELPGGLVINTLQASAGGFRVEGGCSLQVGVDPRDVIVLPAER